MKYYQLISEKMVIILLKDMLKNFIPQGMSAAIYTQTTDVEAVDECILGLQLVVEELQDLVHAVEIHPAYNQYRYEHTLAFCYNLAGGSHGPLPRAPQGCYLVVELWGGGENGNLYGSHTKLVEDFNIVLGEECAIGEQVELCARKAHHHCQVVDVGHQHRLTTREGDAPNGGLTEKSAKGATRQTMVGCGDLGWALSALPIVVAELAGLIAGIRKLIDNSAYRGLIPR